MLSALKISRPHFWIYLLGPYLIGSVAALTMDTGHISIAAIILGCYFIFPANLFIYGINDIFDYETDVINNKKTGYETLVDRSYHKRLTILILITNLPFLILLPFLRIPAILALGNFVFLGLFYSAPPLRAKARPFLDSAFNILYVMPGIAAYLAFGGIQLSWPLIAAAMLWSAAMHAYSAAPDIQADTKANIHTIATVLGKQKTLLVCLFLYVSAGIIAGLSLGPVGWIGLGIYALLMLLSLRTQTPEALMKLYKTFPVINALMGATLFFFVLLQ